MSHFKATFTERCIRLTDFIFVKVNNSEVDVLPTEPVNISQRKSLNCLQYTILQTLLSHIAKVIKTTSFC